MKLPKRADAYVAAIGRSNSEAMRSVAHKGTVQGGRLGEAKQPNFQVTCRDGTVLRYRVVDGRLESEGVTAAYAQQNVSDPLNDALHATVSVSPSRPTD